MNAKHIVSDFVKLNTKHEIKVFTSAYHLLTVLLLPSSLGRKKAVSN